jgi:hypothetical protein
MGQDGLPPTVRVQAQDQPASGVPVSPADPRIRLALGVPVVWEAGVGPYTRLWPAAQGIRGLRCCGKPQQYEVRERVCQEVGGVLEYAPFAESGIGSMPEAWLGRTPTLDVPRIGPMANHLELPVSLHRRQADRKLRQLARYGAEGLAFVVRLAMANRGRTRQEAAGPAFWSEGTASLGMGRLCASPAMNRGRSR